MGQGFDADIRELVLQSETMPASHEGARASIAELVANYVIVDALRAPPPRNRIVIFDDVLTTGRQVRAACWNARMVGQVPTRINFDICPTVVATDHGRWTAHQCLRY